MKGGSERRGQGTMNSASAPNFRSWSNVGVKYGKIGYMRVFMSKMISFLLGGLSADISFIKFMTELSGKLY